MRMAEASVAELLVWVLDVDGFPTGWEDPYLGHTPRPSVWALSTGPFDVAVFALFHPIPSIVHLLLSVSHPNLPLDACVSPVSSIEHLLLSFIHAGHPLWVHRTPGSSIEALLLPILEAKVAYDCFSLGTI